MRSFFDVMFATAQCLVTLAGLTWYLNAQPVEQAEAPAAIIAATIADMPKGTKSSVSPEAVVIDESKKVWLNRIHLVGGETGVVVLFHQDGTYEVEISDEKLRWIKVPVTDEMKKILVPVKVLVVKPAKK